MTKSQQIPDSPQKAANQNNMTSDDPQDGHRPTNKPEAIEKSAAEQPPEQERQDEEAIEAFGERGAASPKERSDA